MRAVDGIVRLIAIWLLIPIGGAVSSEPTAQIGEREICGNFSYAGDLQSGTRYRLEIVAVPLKSGIEKPATYSRYWGFSNHATDCRLARLSLEINGKEHEVVQGAIRDILNVHIGPQFLSSEISISGGLSAQVISLKGGDGGNSYRVEFRFSNGKLIRRDVYGFDRNFEFRLLSKKFFR